MRKFTVVLCAVALVIASVSPSLARVWNQSRITLHEGPFFCGQTPTLALLYGVQPVVSNFTVESNLRWPNAVHQTPFGWEVYSIGPGYIAGNGGRSIVSSETPVTFGQDGYFYSTSYDTAPSYVPLRPISSGGTNGPVWPYGGYSGPSSAFVSADPSGAVYMAVGNTVARSTGTKWSEPTKLGVAATDLAVSAFGDIAVSGVSATNGLSAVTWFDYKSGTWLQRELAAWQPRWKVDVEWDKFGNLGVAYSDPQHGYVKFDYLNMETGLWTSDIVNSQQTCGLEGAALAFDRFGNPVVACGDSIYYDPAPVPEPSALLALLTGVSGLALGRRALSIRKR